MSQASIGDRAPDFELVDLDGRWRRLSDALVHGPVALVFFTSSCPTCEFTFPFLEKIFAQVGHKAGWTLWGVSQEEAAETRAFKERFGITFDLLIDEYPYPVSSAYGLQFVPAIFMVEPDGGISLSELGFTKDGLNQIAGFEFLAPNGALPARRPGCRSKN